MIHVPLNPYNSERDKMDNKVIGDSFPEEYLMVIMGEEPWYANIVEG